MDWNWISEELKMEWPVITQTPLASGIAVVVMSSLIGFVIYKLFSEQLKRKNDLVADLERKLKHSARDVRAPYQQVKDKVVQPSIIQSENNKTREGQQSPLNINFSDEQSCSEYFGSTCSIIQAMTCTTYGRKLARSDPSQAVERTRRILSSPVRHSSYNFKRIDPSSIVRRT